MLVLVGMALASFAVLGYCAMRRPSAEVAETSIADQNTHIINATVQGLKQRMKDPDATQTRNVRMASLNGNPLVCGEYNAKNSFGAYTGFKAFAGVGTMVFTAEDTALGEGVVEALAACRR